jgi:hypothetical protein
MSVCDDEAQSGRCIDRGRHQCGRIKLQDRPEATTFFGIELNLLGGRLQREKGPDLLRLARTGAASGGQSPVCQADVRHLL